LRIMRIYVARVITALLVALTVNRSQPYAQVQQNPPKQMAQQVQRPTPPRPPAPDLPDDNSLLVLIQTTLIALNQANATGNYTVFREIGAPGFQSANSTAKLTEIFANLRHSNIDMSAILLIQPKLLRKPTINEDGMLRVTGFFPMQPFQVNFDLIFQSVEAQWRVFGIAVGTSPAQPMAIAPQSVPAQTPNPSAPVAKQAPAAPGP
jgi:hypothetical protein